MASIRPLLKKPALLCSALLAAALTTLSAPTLAGEAMVVVGNGNAVDFLAVGYRTDPWKVWKYEGGGSLTAFGEAELAQWHGKEAQVAGTETNRNITSIGFKPVVRYAPFESQSFRPFIEAGLGAHLLSHTAINQNRHLPTVFEFGEILGVGAEFCPKLACSLSVRLQHVSNAGLKQPNNGITFTNVSFGYKF